MHRTAAQDAGADQRMRIDIGVAEELIAVGHHPRHRADGKVGQRRGIVVHLVGEHPQVSGAQPPVFAALQAQHRQRGKHARRAGLFGDNCHRWGWRVHYSGAPFYWKSSARPMDKRSAQPANRLADQDQPVPAPARAQPGGLVCVGAGGAGARAARSTSRSCCRSAMPPATGAMSWRTNRSRIRPSRPR